MSTWFVQTIIGCWHSSEVSLTCSTQWTQNHLPERLCSFSKAVVDRSWSDWMTKIKLKRKNNLEYKKKCRILFRNYATIVRRNIFIFFLKEHNKRKSKWWFFYFDENQNDDFFNYKNLLRIKIKKILIFVNFCVLFRFSREFFTASNYQFDACNRQSL